MLHNDDRDTGKLVRKTSGSPFKSKLYVNTVKGVIKHPITFKPAYIFYEDETHVEAWKCEEVKDLEERDKLRHKEVTHKN